MKAKPIAERFAEAQDALAEAQRNYERIRSDYFADRRKRARAGMDLEPLECLDSGAWQEQLHHEAVARSNGEQDRLSGLAA
ncbi:MAG TPA: hypothetical protein VFV91_02500 [Gaiellaceae bacterium]|nr:hypothetical protein [Gaiellaceae bacterium]